MKKLALIFITLFFLVGCGARYVGPGASDTGRTDYTDPTLDTPRETLVRNWLRTELTRINEKRDVVDDMFKTGQISYPEYFLLLEECDNEKRTILQRIPPDLR